MKRCWLILCLLTASLRAEWKDLHEGEDARTVVSLIGEPLLRSRGKNGVFETWTYDCGGCVCFINGRVSYWRVPAPPAK